MNKKRLYKQSGALHPRGEKLRIKLQLEAAAVFLQYSQYHPRDLQLLLMDVTAVCAAMAVYAPDLLKKDKPPKTVKSV